MSYILYVEPLCPIKVFENYNKAQEEAIRESGLLGKTVHILDTDNALVSIEDD